MEIHVATNVPWHIRDIWPELLTVYDKTCLLYAGRNSNSVLKLTDQELTDIINEQLIVGKELIVLDNSHETLIESEISKVYSILPNLNTTSDNIYYITNSSDAVCIHEILCERNNWTNPINIVVFNTFEYVSKQHARIDHYIPYTVGPRQRKFLCMNRMPHLYRICLLGLMLENNLLDQAYYSFYDNQVCVSEETENNICSRLSNELADTIMSQVRNNIGMLPLQLTLDEFASNPNGITMQDAELFRDTYFSVIPETYFFNNTFLNEMNTVFHSEKVFNAIVMKHPFIIVGLPNTLDHLHHNGYRTFHPYIDESYDDIMDDEQRLLKIIDEVKRLSSLTTEQLVEWQESIKEIVEYNYQVMMNRYPRPLNGVTIRKNNND